VASFTLTDFLINAQQAGVPVASTVGTFGGHTHSSEYLMAEHDAGVAGGMGRLQ